MNASFYAAVQGATGQQTKMDVIANNMANINTTGYKSKNAVFSELIRKNLNNREEIQNPVDSGSGAAIRLIGTDYTPAGLTQTGNRDDYAIIGKGFFMLQNPLSGQISYTRDGNFIRSLRGDEFYLASSEGKMVLDPQGRPIRMEEGAAADIGIFGFAVEAGLISTGNNEYKASALSGEPRLSDSASLAQGALELSGVDLAMEMAKAMEAQKAYAMALKMIQTSDEVTDTINSLR